jgi:hypothetical protein
VSAIDLPLVFVNCTNRKRRPTVATLRLDHLRRGTADQVARDWVQRLDKAPESYPASRLYCGRAVTEALAAVALMRASLYFVSAGLGVVPADRPVPPYNLTVTPGNPNSVLLRLPEGSTSATWWSALTAARGTPNPLGGRLSESTGIVLLAMPSTYIDLLTGELLALPPKARDRLRILGPRRHTELPPCLRAQWMPYDRRLEASRGFAGTESDFAQRALRHFAERVLFADPHGTANAHAEAVNRTLGTRSIDRPVPGRRMSDEELTLVIRRLWLEQDGNRGRMLRELRRTLRVACEQSRFKRLADHLTGETRAKD